MTTLERNVEEERIGQVVGPKETRKEA
jgi:hypothetical protein